jgi:HAD superfamily hydrolase (TIGR01458 family)
MATRIPYRAILLDLEGTLFDDAGPVAGAAEAVARLRGAGLAVRYVTNATRRPRSALVARLVELGFPARREELFTAVSAAAAWCRAEGRETVLALLSRETLEDLEGLRVLTTPAMGTEEPRAVVLGDLGPEWTYDTLNTAFRCLLDGAALVACQKNRYWRTRDGLTLDAGPFVCALEYAARTEAVVTGKPSPILFRAAIADLGIEPREALMVGDDAEIDVGGAIAAGLAGWLVKTGKYQLGDESRTNPWAECVLESVAELPAALGLD